MEHYQNLSGDSGVAGYDLGDDWITVTFKDGGVYTYTYASAGEAHIEQMKALAEAGQGLNGYINSHVKKLYANKSHT